MFCGKRNYYKVGILHILREEIQLLLNRKIIFYIFNGILYSLIMNLHYKMPITDKGSLFALQKYMLSICQIASWGQTEINPGNPNCII